MKGLQSEEISSLDLNSNKETAKMNLFIRAFVFIYIFLILPDAFASQPNYKSPISNIEVEGLYSIKKEELLNLLCLRIGEVLDRNALSIGIKRAFLKGIFDDIVIEGSPDYANIYVRVQEKMIIDKIEIIGNNHFSNKFIKNNFGVKESERVSPIRISQGINSLREQMKKRGFPNSVVNYSITPLKATKCYLKLTIYEGSPEIINKIVITGNYEIVRSYLNLSEGDIYDETRMERLKINILDYLIKQEHIGVYIKYEFKDGILSIDLHSGRRLEIIFVGNDSITDKTLKEEIFFYEIDEINLDIAEEMKTRLISAYHKRGFPFADIISIMSETPDTVSLNFYIFEGVRYRVREISFAGTKMPGERLINILTLRKRDFFDITAIEPNRETLIEFLHSLGYLEAIVASPEISMYDDLVDIVFFVTEGEQTIISNIIFFNNKFFTEAELLAKIPLKPGVPYNELDISDARQKIQNSYARSGFIKARVLPESIFTNHSAEIKFIIEEGEMTSFGKTIVVGNERTKLKVIERELQHKESDPFNYSLVLKERHQLQRLGLFRDVDVKLSDYIVENKRDIIYYLDEANHGVIEFGVGYGEYERYRLFLDLSYKNLWGMNRFGSLRTELSSLEKRFIISYIDPWFIFTNRRFSFKSLLLFEDRKDISLDTRDILYKLRRTSASAGLEKNINENIKADLYYLFSVVNTSDVKPDIILSREDVGTLIISGFKSGLIFDTRDNPFEPTKGVLTGLSVKIASSLFLGETDFIKVIFYGNKYLKLSDRIVFATSLSGGIAEGFSSTNELPIVERFFLGGRTSVRGYAQDMLGPKGKDGNPTGGNVFAMGNVELRTDVGRDIGIVGFFDAGNVWQNISQVDISGFKFTTGIGLRYKTPVGPLRIDYGFKLKREPGESRGELHFSLGHAF